MGTGAVGGYFGGKLVLGGSDVTFIARGANLAALRDNGLTVESEHEPLHLRRISVTDDSSALQWLSGAAVDLGAAVGVPTPANRAVRDILVLRAAGRVRP